MIDLEYLSDKHGELKAVVIPIQVWKKLLPKGLYAADELPDAIEDYCLSKAMDEAKATPLLAKDEALAYLRKGE